MQNLDIAQIPLLGHSLIEASAGTGKTYTISQLVLRLILEAQIGLKDRPLFIQEILVVTFTKAATQELKDRIRSNINEALNYLSASSINDSTARDDILAQLVDKACATHGSQDSYVLLKEALLYLDDAPIFTIHGFCQRLLSDYSFLTAQAYQQHLLENNVDVLHELAQKIWRQWLYPAEQQQVLYFKSFFSSPEALVNKLRHVLDDLLVDVSCMPANEDENNPDKRMQALQDAFIDLNALYGKAQQLWLQDHEAIKALFGEGKGRSFTRKTLVKRYSELDQYFSQPASMLTQFSLAACFCQSFINQKVTKDIPEHPLFNVLETMQAQLKALRINFLAQIRLQFIEQMQEAQHEKNIIFFDDLVKRLAEVLSNEDANAEQLSQLLVAQYPAALIDEFQDTDQSQYQVFANIYHQQNTSCCLMIGDPKQAIYSFRGADINSYFMARDNVIAEQCYTLSTNYRTVPNLVKNINRLFIKQADAFYLDTFPAYPEVDSPPTFSKKTSLRLHTQSQDLDCNFSVLRLEGNSKTTLDLLRHQAAEKTALFVQQLLDRHMLVNEEQVKPKDIAILVRNGLQAQLMKEALAACSVNSVYLSKESVLSSQESESFVRLLLAIAEPFQLALSLAALADKLIAYDFDQITALKKDARALQVKQQLFINAHERWLKFGFMSMWQQLVKDFSIYETLLALDNGERAVTNLLQITEIFQSIDQMPIASLQKIEHFQLWMNNSLESDEFQKLRLETEANLVQIVTIHKSKGLEYNVVCCPFLFDGGFASKDIYTTTFNNELQQRELHWDSVDDIKEGVARANMAEDIRLLYVALTRAAYHFNCCWGPVKNVNKSALYHLLYHTNTTLKSLDEKDFWQPFDELEGMSFDPLMDMTDASNISNGKMKTPYKPQLEAENLCVRNFNSLPKHRPVARSYSALLQLGSQMTGQNAESIDDPARDRDSAIRDKQVMPEPEFTYSIFHFPKGSDAGNFMHQVLEDISFDADKDALSIVVESNLIKYGFDVSAWLKPVTEFFSECLRTPLRPLNISLSALADAAISKEMGFYLPAKASQGSVFSQILKHYRQSLSAEKNSSSCAVTKIFADIEGLFKGFIDLIFEHQGKYYVLDYKSNFLGFEKEDYHVHAMQEAIESHYYDLQYLIYVAALQRYLKQRLLDYDYEKHIGGVFYVFLRGMNKDQDNNAEGIYFTKPSQHTIDALEALFCDHQYDQDKFLADHAEQV